MAEASISCRQPGLQTTIQAAARVGYRHLGVPAAGPADPLALALANKLVGNPPLAPGLECTLTGPELQFSVACRIALAGAPFDAQLNGRPVEFHCRVDVQPGDVLRLGAARAGMRACIAFAGGLVAEDFLGSTSTYLPAQLGGLQGRALQAGDSLQLAAGGNRDEPGQTPAAFQPPIMPRVVLRACPGADFDCLSETDRHDLAEGSWTIGRRADRMGMVLDGPALTSFARGGLPSAPVFPGTVQLPADGRPFLLSVDAQTTGGYARVLQVARVDRQLLGQLRPGESVRFLLRTPQQAAQELRAKLDYWRPWLPQIEAIL